MKKLASTNRWRNLTKKRLMDRNIDNYLCWLLLVAAILAAHKLLISVNDPFFAGDGAHRMTWARMPVVRLNERIWLPFLQIHIWLLYLLRLPAWCFKLIPVFYFFVAEISLGLITAKVAGRERSSLMFATVLMFCFAFQCPVYSLSGELHQEMPGMALFFLLVLGGMLELRKSWSLLFGGVLILTARDTYWFYLLTLTILNLREIGRVRSYRLSFMLLWSVPAVWYLGIYFGHWLVVGRLLKVPVEWPLMMVRQEGRLLAEFPKGAKSLWEALETSHILTPVSVLLVLALVWLLVNHRTAYESGGSIHEFAGRFLPFSMLSLGIVYALILVLDPWVTTYGNTRMTVPLVEQTYLWAIILFGIAATAPAHMRKLSRAAVVAGLFAGIAWTPGAWFPTDNSEAWSAHAAIRHLLKESSLGEPPSVCLVGDQSWEATRRFIGAALYADLHQGQPANWELPSACTIVVARLDVGFVPARDLIKEGNWIVDKQPYAIYRRVRVRRSLASCD